MKWFYELSGIPAEDLLHISIPKEKIVRNIKIKSLKTAMQEELDNIEDIVYHAIFRQKNARQTVDELHVIEVKLYRPIFFKVIAEAFQRAIPYRQIVIFSSKEKYLLFETSDPKKSVEGFQFSEWVYEEELMIDCDLGVKREYERLITVDNPDTWKELPQRLRELFETGDFICLRHLVDILRIREIRSQKELIKSILSQLIDKDYLEYFEDIPFVVRTNAESFYHFTNQCFGNIEDERYGTDRQFEPLAESDFMTFSEMTDFLDRIHVSLCCSGMTNYDDD